MRIIDVNNFKNQFQKIHVYLDVWCFEELSLISHGFIESNNMFYDGLKCQPYVLKV